MARIHETDQGYFYEVDDIDILLTDETYSAFQHRHTAYQLLDWIGVLDPRDGEHFSHFRYDQPPEAFDEMMKLATNIGTYVLMDTPYDYIQQMFDRGHHLDDQDFEHLLDGS